MGAHGAAPPEYEGTRERRQGPSRCGRLAMRLGAHLRIIQTRLLKFEALFRNLLFSLNFIQKRKSHFAKIRPINLERRQNSADHRSPDERRGISACSYFGPACQRADGVACGLGLYSLDGVAGADRDRELCRGRRRDQHSLRLAGFLPSLRWRVRTPPTRRRMSTCPPRPSGRSTASTNGSMPRLNPSPIRVVTGCRRQMGLSARRQRRLRGFRAFQAPAV